MGAFGTSLGAAMREARMRAGLTLRDLERISSGRFKPSAVGGYERGERDISAERFVDLAFALGTTPEELLGDAMRRGFPKTHVEASIDLAALQRRDGTDSARAVRAFAHRVQLERQDLFGDVLTVRAGDLEVIARDAGTDMPALLDELGDAIIRIGPG